MNVHDCGVASKVIYTGKLVWYELNAPWAIVELDNGFWSEDRKTRISRLVVSVDHISKQEES